MSGKPLRRHCPYCGRVIGGLVCSDHGDLPNLDPHLSRPKVNAKPVGVQPFATVGQYLPDSSTREILAECRGITLEGIGDYRRASWMKQAGFEQIGSGRTFETMVFRAGERCTVEDCGCGLPALDPPSELDSDAYNDAGSATRGHYAMCEKWAQIDPADTERVENRVER